ncbi:DUF2194 domain-containing protein [uncultured Abiotrophia sp.]|uniref:DUF2194 domain-containing protein n=1 Tax=uncultured Abiotrophia sp. TaxID=316094 RepID=UPI0028D0DE41|nr:DUF2194 domain-containing protein [uncultured Abiotrophia sp.]
MKGWKQFRYWGIFLVFIGFLGLAVALFIERQGIGYQIPEQAYTYLTGAVVTANQAQSQVPVNTLVVTDSRDPSSMLAKEQFQQIFKDMKVGYNLIDIATESFPDVKSYEKVVMLVSQLDDLDQELIALRDWVESGGYVQFALTLQKSSHLSLIEQALGIKQSQAEHGLVDKLYIEPDFMIGGGREYIIEEPFDSALKVDLSEKAKVHVSRKEGPGVLPLIWEHAYGKGKFVIDNFGIYNKVTRGLYAASYNLLGKVASYPVINGSVFYLDDFPAPVPSGDGKYVKRDYNLNVADFYTNIWWVDMLSFVDKYGIKYTGATIENYEDDTSGNVHGQDDISRFVYFGNMLLRSGGEIGYHGYNHQPLSPKSLDYKDVYSYHTWEESAMVSAMKELVRFNEELFPNVEKSVYVPPSNVLSAEGRKVLVEEIPEIKTIASNYFPGDFAYDQEFEWASDGMVEQPRIISGGMLDDFMQLAAFSELNMHFVNSHFIHPDDTLDVDRGAELGWAVLKSNLEHYISWLKSSAPDLRDLTGSQLSGAIQRYSALVPKQERTATGIEWTFDHFYDEVYLFVRINEGQVGSHVNGGTLTHLTGNLYLLKATQAKVTMDWSEE